MQYDDNILGRLNDHSGTLKSNWPSDLPSARKRKERVFYAVDVDEETIGTSKDLKLASELAANFGGTVRPVVVNEDTLRREESARRRRRSVGNFTAYED